MANLADKNFAMFVVSDASASRTMEIDLACLTRLTATGVCVVPTEMMIFEWLGLSGTPAFKSLLPLIKH